MERNSHQAYRIAHLYTLQIDPREFSEIAGCSFDFFQKVFSYLNGISFSNYVRARKLTLAGYDSPTSFTKAFQQFHGVAPKDARNQDVRLRAVPKMQSSVQEQYMWRLEQKVSYPFHHAKCPELEWYSDGNSYAADYLSQIWIPVIDSR